MLVGGGWVFLVNMKIDKLNMDVRSSADFYFSMFIIFMPISFLLSI